MIDADNIERYESKMTAGERRLIVIGFMCKTMRNVMTQEHAAMQVGCFESA